VSALAGADGGVLCGDDTGDVFLLRHTEDGWHTARSLEAVRPVLAVTVVSHGDVNEVVAGGPDGELLIRDGADGTARGRLRSICGSAVGALATEYAPGPSTADPQRARHRGELGLRRPGTKMARGVGARPPQDTRDLGDTTR
jgi:hypothetical protein